MSDAPLDLSMRHLRRRYLAGTLSPRTLLDAIHANIDDPVPGLKLPNLEDPRQLLRPETFVTGDPRAGTCSRCRPATSPPTT